jgi:hypothetical protein
VVTPPPADGPIARERHIVLLGASNLTRGLPTVLQTMRRYCGGPLTAWIAAGHGRSYGMPSTVLGRTLPGILESELWETLERQQVAPSAALVTDIGNDLMFGAQVEQIIGWVQSCLERLQQSATPHIILTALPTANLQHLSPHRFYVLRSLLFPTCRLSFETIIERAFALDDAVRSLAQARGVHLEAPRSQWYGIDPIHVRYRQLDDAWSTLLAAWRQSERAAPERYAWHEWWRIVRLKPAQRWVRGVEQRAVQPALVLRDGTSIALY